MTRYQRLSPDSTGPNICRKHNLINYTKIQADIDARALREAAVADAPETLAQAGQCADTQNWHIYIPTRARMRVLRRNARQAKGRQGDVPRETKED